MNRDTHRIIADKIARELDFGLENWHIFVDGCIGPDSHGDFPHDVGKEKKTLAKIDEARTLYFLNDEYAYGELGNALHYIQDTWVDNVSILTEASLLDDNGLLEYLEELVLHEQIRAQYRQIAKNLVDIKNSGIEAWFDHSWGIWHKDYASCVFVFADIVELMLPTLEPNIDQTRKKQGLLEYVNSKRFENATREGFLASIITNFLYPKLSGYPAAMYSLASMNPPLVDKATKAINLNIVYRLCLELARYTLSPSSIFKFEDDWSVKAEKTKHIPLALIMPEYHELIKWPIADIQKERNNRFFDEGRNFLKEWPSIKQVLYRSESRTETWKIIISGLVKFLG